MVLVYTQYTYATFAYIFVYTPMYFYIYFKSLVDINCCPLSISRKKEKKEREGKGSVVSSRTVPYSTTVRKPCQAQTKTSL